MHNISLTFFMQFLMIFDYKNTLGYFKHQMSTEVNQSKTGSKGINGKK